MVQLTLIHLSTLPGVNFLLPLTDGFAQLGVVLEGSAARLQAVAGAHHQRQQRLQRHGDSTQGVRGNSEVPSFSKKYVHKQ